MGILVKLAIFVLVAVSGVIAVRRMSAAAREPIPDDVCVSCGSGNVHSQAPGAYTCLACGYEGGSARAQMAREKLASRYAALTPDARLDRITEHVRAAARILNDDGIEIAMDRRATSPLDLESDASFCDGSSNNTAHDLSAAAVELRTASEIADGPIVLRNGLSVDADGVAQSLEQCQEKLLASIAMETTAGEACAYLTEVLRGLDTPSSTRGSSPAAEDRDAATSDSP